VTSWYISPRDGVAPPPPPPSTHVWLAAVGAATVAVHLGGLDRLAQGDGVGLVLAVHVVAVVVLLRFAVLRDGGGRDRNAKGLASTNMYVVRDEPRSGCDSDVHIHHIEWHSMFQLDNDLFLNALKTMKVFK